MYTPGDMLVFGHLDDDRMSRQAKTGVAEDKSKGQHQQKEIQGLCDPSDMAIHGL